MEGRRPAQEMWIPKTGLDLAAVADANIRILCRHVQKRQEVLWSGVSTEEVRC